MSNLKHTPGPWELLPRGDGYDIKALTHMDVGHVNWREFPSGECNAKLIVAAPDMLQALLQCINALYEAVEIAPLNRLPGKAVEAIQQAQYVVEKAINLPYSEIK